MNFNHKYFHVNPSICLVANKYLILRLLPDPELCNFSTLLQKSYMDQITVDILFPFLVAVVLCPFLVLVIPPPRRRLAQIFGGFNGYDIHTFTDQSHETPLGLECRHIYVDGVLTAPLGYYSPTCPLSIFVPLTILVFVCPTH